MNCPKCGNPLRPDMEYCVFCKIAELKGKTNQNTGADGKQRVTEQEFPVASAMKRFGAFAVDAVIVVAIYFPLAMASKDSTSLLSDSAQKGMGIMLMLAYSLFFTVIWQATPGKMIVGIKVVDRDLRKPSFWIIFLREVLGKWLAPFCLGHLWLFFDSERKESWDCLAHTLVIEK